jgi:hypothetical protein
LATNFASRQGEYRADELACMIAGHQPLIDGLGAAMAWPTYWNTELAPVLNNGALPGIAEGFARFTSVPNIYEQMQKGIEKQIQEAQANPYESHPPLRDRIEAARKVSGELVQEDSQPARTLLDRPDALELRFVEGANPDMKPGTLRCITWDEVGAKVTIPQWKKFAAEYSSFLEGVTAESLPVQIPKLPKIGSSMRDPKGMLLGPEQRRQRAGNLFAVGLALALIDRSWRLINEPGIFILRGPKCELDPFLAVSGLIAGKLTADEWILRCRTLGVADLLLAPATPQRVGLPGVEASTS